MKFKVVNSDITNVDAEVIVNAWNRNIIPWFLLIPTGVSGAIKKKAGFSPFNQLLKVGPMKLGSAVITTAGRLPYKGIIHVAGINMLWMASEKSIRQSVSSSIEIVNSIGFKSIAIPLIGAGSGSFNECESLQIIESQLAKENCDAMAIIVRKKNNRGQTIRNKAKK